MPSSQPLNGCAIVVSLMAAADLDLGPFDAAGEFQRAAQGARLVPAAARMAELAPMSPSSDRAVGLAALEDPVAAADAGTERAERDSEATASAARYALAALEHVAARANSYASNSKSAATI